MEEGFLEEEEQQRYWVWINPERSGFGTEERSNGLACVFYPPFFEMEKRSSIFIGGAAREKEEEEPPPSPFARRGGRAGDLASPDSPSGCARRPGGSRSEPPRSPANRGIPHFSNFTFWQVAKI